MENTQLIQSLLRDISEETKNTVTQLKSDISNAYTSISDKGGTLPEEQTAGNLADAIDSIPDSLPLGFTQAPDTPAVTSALSAMVDYRTIEEIDDPTVTSMYKENIFRDYTNLVRVSFPNLTSWQGYSTFYGCTNLEEINMPELVDMSNLPNAGYNNNSWRFYNCSKLKELVFPKLTNLVGDRIFEIVSSNCTLERISVPELTTWRGSAWWYGAADDLIDVELGKNFTGNFGYLARWSAANAIKSDSTSLVKPGETFSSNLEKLLYNIREHIAKNLSPQVTATITFSANVYNAIQADPTTVAAFPASWTIASA